MINTARTFSASEHPITPDNISINAISVMRKLREAGFSAYLVGGALRDLYLGIKPKDFDIATNATPEQCKQLFRRQARIIGRRFQIVHVRFGREIIELTTFRGDHQAATANPKSNQHSAANASGVLLRDNVFASIEEDALRRDFRCNALYYDDDSNQVFDFCDSVSDIQARQICMIGEPAIRFTEDPVRMLRAVRFAAKLGFKIETSTDQAIAPHAHLLSAIPAARLFDETLKLFFQGHAEASFDQLEHYQLSQFLIADFDRYATDPAQKKLISLALRNTDRRIQQGKSITPAFLWAIFLWPKLQYLQREIQRLYGTAPIPAMHEAAQQCIQEQNYIAAIPKRFSTTMREIWALQFSLQRIQGKRPFRTFEHPRFRAAYDFLLLREESGECPAEFGQWWTDFQQHSTSQREAMLDETNSKTRRPRKRSSRHPSTSR